MNGAPWWIPIGAAGIALLGVAVGQLLGAWAEGCRQRRDIQRRTFEHWRDKKLDLYSTVIQKSNLWLSAATGIVTTLHAISHAREKEKIASFVGDRLRKQLESSTSGLQDLLDLLVSVGLVSSAAWYRQAQAACSNMAFLGSAILFRMEDKGPISVDEFYERLVAVRAHIDQLQIVARSELKIPT